MFAYKTIANLAIVLFPRGAVAGCVLASLKWGLTLSVHQYSPMGGDFPGLSAFQSDP